MASAGTASGTASTRISVAYSQSGEDSGQQEGEPEEPEEGRRSLGLTAAFLGEGGAAGYGVGGCIFLHY